MARRLRGEGDRAATIAPGLRSAQHSFTLARVEGFARADLVKKPAPAQPAPAAKDEPLAEIGETIARLTQRRDRQRDEALRGSYRAAIERLSALSYRIKTKPEGQVIGLPAKQTVPPPAPEPPQRTLPLGPVPVIVRARKPKRAPLLPVSGYDLLSLVLLPAQPIIPSTALFLNRPAAGRVRDPARCAGRFASRPATAVGLIHDLPGGRRDAGSCPP
jgi:hypothetical protein